MPGSAFFLALFGMNTLLRTSDTYAVAQPAPAATGLNQLRITAVEPATGIGIVRAHVALAHWLVAVVQAPVGRSYADLQAAFVIGAGWPLVSFPYGYVLLGYLDSRDLATG
jgi:hypothetical protein